MSSAWVPLWGALLACACGGARTPRFFAADRAADAVLGLDDELCLLERVPLRAPRLLVQKGDVLWVAAAEERADPLARRLVRVEWPSRASSEASFETLVGLCADEGGTVDGVTVEGGGVLVLEEPAGASETRLWRVRADLERTLLGAFPRARALASRTGEILVGCAGGELVRLRSDGALSSLARGAAPVAALARGPQGGEWWVLRGSPAEAEARLELVGRDLAPVWSARAAGVQPSFAPLAGEERVWLVGDERARLLGTRGELQAELVLPRGPWQAVAASPASVLLLAPGALLEAGVRGRGACVLRTQGGFAALCALASASAPEQ